jgi:peptide deformylase
LSSIVLIGHKALRTPTRKIPSSWIRKRTAKNLLERMFKIMRRARGVGLAANQLGLPYRLFVMENRNGSRYPGRAGVRPQAWFNPRILSRSGRKLVDWEGCLSIPGYRGLTPRFNRVVFEAVGPDGKKVRKEATGFEARIVQHEVDHLDGLFYVDRMKDLGMWMHEKELRKINRG